MSGIVIHIRDKHRWVLTPDGFAQGFLFMDDELLGPEQIAKSIAERGSLDQVCEFARAANGFFATIRTGTDSLIAVVDRIRSIPLFYGVLQGTLFLSDDAHWVREQVGDHEFDDIATAEFQLLGYVTGADTLSPRVKQLQAGEALEVQHLASGSPEIKTRRYYQFVHRAESSLADEDLLSELDQVMTCIFQRLIERAAGRTIVIPLSGGLDSRLMVCMLKRFGYENVVTFSYGRSGNAESECSREIARQLGFRWEFVPYSHDAWRAWFRTEECELYRRSAGGLVAIAHVQDWPAVWELKKKRLIPEDSLFVPGHSADLLAGSRSGAFPRLYEVDPIPTSVLLNAVWRYHYSLLPSHAEDCQVKVLRDRLASTLKGFNALGGTQDGANFFEYFDWQERQAKFIVNSVRVYEFWGYDWWLPFWDAAFMEFWSRVPLSLRINKSLYDSYVMRQQESVGLQLGSAYTGVTPHWTTALRSLLKCVGMYPFVQTIRRFQRRATEYDGHPLCWHGMMDRKLFNQYFTGRESINSFLALERLGKIRFDDEPRGHSSL
ncbi:MAG: asparagine synthase-related protein [Bacillota bacterium]